MLIMLWHIIGDDNMNRFIRTGLITIFAGTIGYLALKNITYPSDNEMRREQNLINKEFSIDTIRDVKYEQDTYKKENTKKPAHSSLEKKVGSVGSIDKTEKNISKHEQDSINLAKFLYSLEGLNSEEKEDRIGKYIDSLIREKRLEYKQNSNKAVPIPEKYKQGIHGVNLSTIRARARSLDSAAHPDSYPAEYVPPVSIYPPNQDTYIQHDTVYIQEYIQEENSIPSTSIYIDLSPRNRHHEHHEYNGENRRNNHQYKQQEHKPQIVPWTKKPLGK